MLMKIRAALGIENNNDLEGTVEADESFMEARIKIAMLIKR